MFWNRKPAGPDAIIRGMSLPGWQPPAPSTKKSLRRKTAADDDQEYADSVQAKKVENAPQVPPTAAAPQVVAVAPNLPPEVRESLRQLEQAGKLKLTLAAGRRPIRKYRGLRQWWQWLTRDRPKKREKPSKELADLEARRKARQRAYFLRTTPGQRAEHDEAEQQARAALGRLQFARTTREERAADKAASDARARERFRAQQSGFFARFWKGITT